MSFGDEVFNQYQKPHFTDHYGLYFTHLVTSCLWMNIGTYQFYTQGKNNHKIVGYSYYVFSFLSSLTAIPMAVYYNITYAITFGSVNLFFYYLYTGYWSIYYILHKDIINHKKFTQINFAIGIGSVIMRPVMMIVRFLFVPQLFNLQIVYQIYFTLTAYISFIGTILVSHKL
jgi:hypothetical protein